jgi:hypothetical protein
MRIRGVRSTCVILIVSFASCNLAEAAQPSPGISTLQWNAEKSLTAADLLPYLIYIKRSTEVGLTPPFIVDGERIFSSGSGTGSSGPAILATEEIVFKPGSTLILAGPYVGVGERAVIIVTRRITISPGGTPPTITWQKPNAPTSLPPPVGKAPPGRAGAFPGDAGGPGAAGVNGNSGLVGQSAPTVYLAVGSMSQGKLYFDLRGQDGGPGGEGQAGGDGGPGMSGESGASSLFDCKRGGGNGGNGGPGGNGGLGGEGGKGGDGGRVILMAAPDSLLTLSDQLLVNASPGAGGPGGRGGALGEGGPPGAGGPGSGFCGGGRPGQRGPNGLQGATKTNLGPTGLIGGAFPVPLSGDNLDAIRLK